MFHKSDADYQNMYIVTAIVCCVIGYMKWKFGYWARRNVPYVCTIASNTFIRTKSVGQCLKDSYDKLNSMGNEHGGLFSFVTPIYMPISPKCMSNVLQEDFQYFSDKYFYYNKNPDSLSVNIFTANERKWKDLRKKLTPMFNPDRLKNVFEILVECGRSMKETVSKSAYNREPVDIKDIVERFSIDVFGSCVFGQDSNSLKNSDSNFLKFGKMVSNRTSIRQIVTNLLRSCVNLGNLLGIRPLPKSATNFFLQTIQDTSKYRETNKISREDLLDVLVELKNKSVSHNNNDGSTLKVEDIASQALTFFTIGLESASATISFCLYELSLKLELQQKVRDEINQLLSLHGDKITYDFISSLKYTRHVVEETLRKYPPIPVLIRRCVQDYNVPNEHVTIEKETLIYISVLGLHHDSQYYPLPQEFDPDRFSDKNRAQIPKLAYLPFGKGPRNCVAERFVLLHILVGLTVLLKNFEFSLNLKTKTPIGLNSNEIFLTSKDTIWLNTVDLNKNKIYSIR